VLAVAYTLMDAWISAGEGATTDAKDS
jgi:hypothetical protein